MRETTRIAGAGRQSVTRVDNRSVYAMAGFNDAATCGDNVEIKQLHGASTSGANELTFET